MNLSLYVDRLRHELAVAADAGGEEARALAERLTAPLESAARLVLLEALSAAADEITRELAPGTVEVRLRGADPAFVVTLPPGDELFDDLALSSQPDAAPQAGGPVETDEGGTSRLNLRLPDSLKLRIEEAARMEGLSLNAWLIRAAATALGNDRPSQRRSPSSGERYTGWVR
ncbi:MAG: toxin-antitoxin system HicB family antitoxin [Acidimicrobiia bacterium]